MTIATYLSDGVNTYVYDSANRLISVSNQSSVDSYQYNGLGDRLVQNGTQYTLDLNTGLTQVLDDGTNTYTYGLGRISQTNTTTEYFLGDALGSVRQLTNTVGDITHSKNYSPYGTVLQTAGNSQSSYGFTGEITDLTGLIYLRARYYNPIDARFLTIDPSRLESNLYAYTMGNPVNYIDPSGYITEKEAPDAEKIVRELRIYNVFVEVDWGMQYIPSMRSIKSISNCVWKIGEWELNELIEMRRGVIDLSRAMGGLNKFIFNLGYVNVSKESLSNADYIAVGGTNYFKVNNNKHVLSRWTVVHELGHSWDYKNGKAWSNGLVQFTTSLEPNTNTAVCDPSNRLPGCNNAGYVYAGVPAAGSNINFTAVEDFAESLAAYVYPNEAYKRIYQYKNNKTYKDFLYYADFRTTTRWAYIDSLIRLSIHLQQQR